MSFTFAPIVRELMERIHEKEQIDFTQQLETGLKLFAASKGLTW